MIYFSTRSVAERYTGNIFPWSWLLFIQLSRDVRSKYFVLFMHGMRNWIKLARVVGEYFFGKLLQGVTL